MDVRDDIETDENEILPSDIRSLQPPSIFCTDKSKKNFVKRKRHGSGILAELEPISETNALSGFDLSSRGNFSLVEYVRSNKKKPETYYKSFTYNSSSNLSISSLLDSSVGMPTPSDFEEKKLAESGDLLQMTPPGVLRQRIKEANDAQLYLQKELEELRDFTTAERQILTVEKGYDSLQEENSYLKLEFENIKENNSNLKMEIEATKKLSDSQQSLISNLQENFDKVQRELNHTITEKGTLAKELDRIKTKLTDEEFKNESIQDKFKKRENELKKSLEESWTLLKVKDERLAKINEKVGLLCTERELSANSNVADLYNLSISNFESHISPSIFSEADKFKEDPIENEKGNANELYSDLQKLQKEFENQKYDLNDLKDKLSKKELDFEYLDNGLKELSLSLVFHKDTNKDKEMGSAVCTIEHKDLLETISCEFSQHCQKLTPSVCKCGSVLENNEEQLTKQDLATPQSKSDSGLFLDSDVKHLSSTDLSNNTLNIILSEVGNKPDNISKNEDGLIQNYKERINELEKEISHLKTKVESTEDSSPKDLPCDSKILDNNEFIENCMQTSYKVVDISCQTLVEHVSIKEYIEKINRLEFKIANLNKPIQDEVSCQTNLDFISISEYEHRIDILEKELQDKITNLANEQIDVCCQTIDISPSILNDDIENISVTNFKKVNKSVNCFENNNIFHKNTQVEIEHNDAPLQISNHLEDNVLSENMYQENFSEFIRSPESETSKSVESQALLPSTSMEAENNSDTISDLNDLEIEEPITCDSYFSSPDIQVNKSLPTVKSVCNVFVQTVEDSFSLFTCRACLLSMPQTATEHSLSSGEINDSVLTICESDPLSEGSPLLIDKTSEDYSTISADTTFGSTTDIPYQEKTIRYNQTCNMSFSDSIGEQIKLTENNFSNVSASQNPVLCEYIDLPAADTTELNFTYNSLEHSILKSKLRSSDAGVSEICDPLATESEFPKPIVEIPFIHSLNLMGESKILENKCKALADELASKNVSNQKSLSLLAEFNNLIHPSDLNSESDIIKNSEETLSLIKDVLDAPNANVQYKNVGLLSSFKKVKSVYSILYNILSQVQTMKRENLSLASYAYSLKDMNIEFSNINAQLEDLSQNVEINNDNNSTLIKENFENLRHENKELKEQLLQVKNLNSDLKATSELYDDLLKKHTELKTILEDKDKSIKEILDFKNIYLSFTKNIKDIQLIEGHNMVNEEVFSKSYSSQFLNKIEKNLKDLSNSYRVLENFNLGTNDIAEVIETLYTEKCDMEKSNNVLKYNIDSIREKVLQLEKICCHFKSNFNSLKSDMVDMKGALTQDLIMVNIDIEKLIENKLDSLNKICEENIALKCKIDEISSCSDKYSQLVVSYEELQNEFNLNQSNAVLLKSNLTILQNENSELKTKINISEANLIEKSILIENLEHKYKKLESELLVCKEEFRKLLQNQEDALSCKLQDVDSEKLRSETEILGFQNKIGLLENENKSLKELKEYLEKKALELNQQLNENCINLSLLESLQNENESLKAKLNTFDSLMLTNAEKYSDLSEKHKNLEEESSKYKNNCDDFSEQITFLKGNISELRSEINVLIEDNCNLLEKITEGGLLKIDQEKYLALSEILQQFNKFIKSSEDNFTGSLLENTKFVCDEVFCSTKEIFSELLSMRQKLNDLDKILINVNNEKAELINNLEFLNNEKELSSEARKIEDEEKNDLIKKEQEQSKQLRDIIDKYDYEIADVLSILNYKGTLQISEESWLFIKQNIRNQITSRTCDESNVVLDLQNTINHLESQLFDADNFKRKFSKELNGLKPDLKVSDLMKLSLEELQITMLSTIMEKERDVVSNLEKDFENKLAESCDRIQQLEEESKRSIDWIKEIENENDRLQNDYKQIQHDNENLKSEIKDKAEKIVTLEKKIEKQKANSDNSLLYDSFVAKYEQEQHEISSNELGLQKKINDLSKKLEEKSNECQSAFDSLQNKSGTIFQLEKLNTNLKLEKSQLENEIKSLKEEINNKVSSFTEARKEMEIEIEEHKKSLKEFTGSNNKVACQCDFEALDLVKFLEKFGNDADKILKHNISYILDNHMKKVDKLNIRVKELSVLLNKQNAKFVELKNKESIIEKLKAEVDTQKEINAALNNENSDINKFEACLEENTLLRNELGELKNKLIVMKEEREALIQASVETQAAFKDEISALNDSLKLCQQESESYKNEYHQSVKIKDEYYKIKDEINSLNIQIIKSDEKIKLMQEENTTLKEQCNDYLLLKNEHSKLRSSFEECNIEIKMLKDSQAQLSKPNNDYLNLKEEFDSLNGKIIKYQKEIEDIKSEKETMTKKLLDNLEFEKSVQNSTKLELIEKENNILSLQRENDIVIKELNKFKQSENSKIVSLENEMQKLKEMNNALNLSLTSLKKMLEEKDLSIQNLQTELNTIISKFHSEDSCPFKKESMENKNIANECNKLVAHERETFKQWKTIMEEDIQCKVLFIRDLEAKLLKESQTIKDERLANSVLQHKLHETDNQIKSLEDKITIQREVFINEKGKLEQEVHEAETKLKSLEDKITMQREVFMKEKSKLELEIKMKDLYEQKIIDLQHKSEELVGSINIFLEKVSSTLNKNIPDLGTAYVEISRMLSALEEEKDSVKQLDEECEILNSNLKHLENELGKLFMSNEELKKNFNQEKAKLQNEQVRNEKIINELKIATENLTSLKKEMATLSSQYERERKAFEINISNLLEDKNKIQILYSNLEHKVSSLQSTKEEMLRKDSQKIEDLMKEINHLKLQIVHKNTKISNLEIRLVAESVPFQSKAEAAEKKVEELSKELKSLKYSLNCKETISASTSPYSIKVNPESSRRIEEYVNTITRLQDELKKVEKDKVSLKKLAVMRHKEVRELQERLGLRSIRESSLQDSQK